MNKDVEPRSFFFGQSAAAMAFFRCINLNGGEGLEEGEEGSCIEEVRWKVATNMFSLSFTASFHPEQVHIIFRTSKEIKLEKS